MRTCRIVLFPQVKEFLKNNKLEINKHYTIYGRILQYEKVYQIRRMNREIGNDNQRFQTTFDYKKIGHIHVRPSNSPSVVSPLLKFEIENELEFTLTLDEILIQRRFHKVGNLLDVNETDESINLEILNSDLSRLFIRVKSISLYPLSILNGKKVAIIGLGSGGSKIAIDVVKSGIKNLLLIDGDVFEEHNIVRHLLSLNDLGRYKTLAIKDYLLERIPDLNISTIEEDFKIDTEEQEKRYKSILKDYDILISAVGDHNTNLRLNQFAYPFGKAVIYAGTFDKISGGIMIRVDPTMDDPCYSCIYGSDKSDVTNDDTSKVIRERNVENVPQATPIEQSVAYDRNLEDVLAMPGLAVDIENFTIFVSKFILYNLIKENIFAENYYKDTKNTQVKMFSHSIEDSPVSKYQERTIYKFPHAIYIWYNRDTSKESAGDCSSKNGLELYYYDSDAINDIINNANRNCMICSIATSTDRKE